jgi:ankyrin repeat protein
LVAAVIAHNGEVATVLLKDGANPNTHRRNGDTALGIAAEDGNPGLVELLLTHGATTDQRSSGGRTPLYLAVSKESGDYIKVISVLLAHGASPDARTDNGDSPRLCAVRKADAEIERLLEVTK